jgi:hypothetical protein
MTFASTSDLASSPSTKKNARLDSLGVTELAGPDFYEKIGELRIDCYNKSKEFLLLQPEALKWSKFDDEAVVLLTRSHTGQLLSTMRGAIVNDRDSAEKAMGCSIEGNPRFPSLILGRGATARTQAAAGHNSLLRYHFLVSAESANIGSLLGMVYSGAPRTRLMADLGYTFSTPRTVWDDEVRPLSTIQVAQLQGHEFLRAISRLNDSISEMRRFYPALFPSITLPRCVLE